MFDIVLFFLKWSSHKDCKIDRCIHVHCEILLVKHLMGKSNGLLSVSMCCLLIKARSVHQTGELGTFTMFMRF